MSELLSYNRILSDVKKYKRAGTKHDDFNMYDTPSHKYFKILFYFGSNAEAEFDLYGSGLLAPTWEAFADRNESLQMAKDAQNSPEKDAFGFETFNSSLKRDIADLKFNIEMNDPLHYYDFNSAWAYLKLNDENERAEKLEQFVTLLSDINCNSPWYFHKVSGVSEALERKVTEDGKFEVSDKKISITCLPDAFDNRITTLLDLYRDITWSWVHKREVIPANLRKFDMAIYIFETPEAAWHNDETIIDTKDNTLFNVSYKMIEFHDCEFNYNSIKSGWSELDNQVGVTPTYTIDINFNDCYEISYNDMMMRTIGDVILTDLVNNSKNSNAYASNPQTVSNNKKEQLQYRIENSTSDNDIINKLNANRNINATMTFGNLSDRRGSTGDINVKYKIEYEPGFIGKAAGQVAGHFVKDVKGLFNKAIMGNLYTYSLTKMANQVSDLVKGNVIKTGMSIAQYVKDAQSRKDAKTKKSASGNIYSKTPDTTNEKPSGNIFSGSTLANNL